MLSSASCELPCRRAKTQSAPEVGLNIGEHRADEIISLVGIYPSKPVTNRTIQIQAHGARFCFNITLKNQVCKEAWELECSVWKSRLIHVESPCNTVKDTFNTNCDLWFCFEQPAANKAEESLRTACSVAVFCLPTLNTRAHTCTRVDTHAGGYPHSCPRHAQTGPHTCPPPRT